MNARNVFQSDESLVTFLKGVVHNPQWDKVVMYARAAAMEGQPNPDIVKGFRLFEDTIAGLIEQDDPEPKRPTAGLNHNLDLARVPPKTAKTKTQPVSASPTIAPPTPVKGK